MACSTLLSLIAYPEPTMKLTIPWTPLFAVLTLSLGTLAEGSALAALPQLSAPQQNRQDSFSRAIAQRLPLPPRWQNQCASLSQPTTLTILAENSGDDREVPLPPGTYVKVLTPPDAAEITEVHVMTPALIGWIPSINLRNASDCASADVFRTPPEPEESYACYEVNVTGTWDVYSRPNQVVNPTNRPLSNRELVLYLGDREVGNQLWINIRRVSRSRNATLEDGWIIADDKKIKLDPVRPGVCD